MCVVLLFDNRREDDKSPVRALLLLSGFASLVQQCLSIHGVQPASWAPLYMIVLVSVSAGAGVVSMESLILAQDERWRRA